MLHLDDISAQKHSLSIRLAPDGFSFFTLKRDEKKISHFKHLKIDTYQDPIANALSEMRSEALFSFPFYEVNVLLDFPDVSCVPTPLYSEENKEALFALNANVATNEYIISNTSKAYDLKVLFPIQEELYHFFNKNYPNIRFVHQLSNLLCWAHAYKEKAREQLFISYSGEHFTAVALRNNSLIYHNCFKLVSHEDLVYYLLLVFQELAFDQYEAQVLIDGEIAENHSAIGVIKEYVKHVSFTKHNKALNYSEIGDYPEHYFSTFFSLPFCE